MYIYMYMYIYMCTLYMYNMCIEQNAHACVYDYTLYVFHSLIRDSAPFINSVIICGCVLMLVTCYLLGIDTQTPSVAGDASVADEDLLDDESHIIDSRNDRYAIICNV